jgi:hypothetical protein
MAWRIKPRKLLATLFSRWVARELQILPLLTSVIAELLARIGRKPGELIG